MELTAPLSRLDELEPLVRAGARELYTGVLPREWRRFGPLSAPSKRPTPNANLDGVEALAEAAARAHALGARLFLALNAPSIAPEEYPALVALAKESAAAGVDALIVAELSLLVALRSARVATALHLSSLGRATNREAVRFFVELGVSRVILSRQARLEEIGAAARAHPGLELEVFGLNDGCAFEEALCATTHAAGAFCAGRWRWRELGPAGASAPVTPEWAAHLEEYERWRLELGEGRQAADPRGVPQGACGLCAIPRLLEAGVHAFKIVGREAGPARKLRSVQLAAAVLAAARRGAPSSEIARLARELRGTPDRCERGFACYYAPDEARRP